MAESALNVSASRADNSSVGRIETEAYLLANKNSDATVKRMVKLSADDPADDPSKIGEAETSVSVDADHTVTNLKPVKSSIAEKPLAEKQTTANFIGDVTMAEEEYFITGSSYKGSWDALGMAGVGRYVMPHGAAYEGEIRDGMFHGQGSLYWPNNKRLDVVHLRGKLLGHRYTFEDGLVYQDEDWSYCKFPDRRFYESVKKGLRPGGRTLKTARQPTKVLPSGCYDAGDGAFNPKIFRIISYDNAEKVLRVPTKEESDWIVKYCRKSWTEPTGYRPSLNENWSKNPPDLPYHIAMSEDSPDSWWKRLTTFKRKFHTVGAEDGEDTCQTSQSEDIPAQEICLCGQYVILGEPCHCASVAIPFDDEEETEEINNTLQSVSHSLNCLDVKSISREKRKSIRIAGQEGNRVKESSAGTPEYSETNTDNSASVSGEFSQYFFSDEFAGNDLENREDSRIKSKHDVGKKVLKKSAVDHHRVKHRGGRDGSKEAILKKLATENSKEIEEKLKYTTEQEVVTERSEETDARQEYTVGEKEQIEVEKFEEKSSVKKNREKEEKKSSMEIHREDQQIIDEERRKQGGPVQGSIEEIVGRRKAVLTKENTQIADDETNEAEIGGSEDLSNELLAEKTAVEGRKEKKGQRGPPLENYEHAAASIRREKVPSVTEPETRDDRRMHSERSTLLPKGASIESDVPYDRSNEKQATGLAVIDGSAIRETVQENDFVGSVSSKNLEDVAVNVLPDAVGKKRLRDAADDDKLHEVPSDGPKLMLDKTEEIAETPEVEQSTERFHGSMETMNRTEKKFKGYDHSRSKKYAEASKASIRPRDEPKKKAMASGRITSKVSRSKNIDEAIATERSSVLSKDDLPILEKLRHSLAVLPSGNQKPTEEKEIIEIYRKCSMKEKSKASECANVNVWRLSGAAQNDSQTKMEDHLHSILTAPRCEIMECTRKPCVVRVREPTVPEVRTTASRCRKEFPFDIPAKQSRSSAERTGCRNK